MKIIAVGAVTAGGKTTAVSALKEKLPNAAALFFDDYEFEGEVTDFRQWISDGADCNVWNLSPLKADIEKIRNSGKYDYLLLDYPFAYQHTMLNDCIDCCIFIDTPLDIALARRILRDMKAASADEIRQEMESYLQYARIAYIQMLTDILPDSDYVIDGSQPPECIISEILEIITQKERKR